MNADEYLQKVLEAQTLGNDASELEALRKKRTEVEAVLRSAFASSGVTIRYGGSKAKGTLIRASYDLDILSFFPHDESEAGENLLQIYENVRAALSEYYLVDSSGTTALKLRASDDSGTYLHIDVVPGRFTDDTKTDAYLHQQNGDKQRLKTNPQTHINHIKNSGVVDAIKLAKYWRECYGFKAKTFILELLVVKILATHKNKPLSEQMLVLWRRLRDDLDNITLEDPANPTGNDLSEAFNAVRPQLRFAAESTLRTIDETGWEAIFGQPDKDINSTARDALLDKLPYLQTERPKPKPWAE